MCPSRTNELRLEAALVAQVRLAARVGGVHVAVEHQARAAAGALEAPDDVRAAVLDLLPADARGPSPRACRACTRPSACSLPVGLEMSTNERAVVDQARLVDAPAARARAALIGSRCGRTSVANSSIWRSRSSPHSSSITCVQPASRYSSIAAMQSAGVPAIGLQRSRISSLTAAAAARRPPRSIASAIGRDLLPARARRARAARRPSPGCSGPCWRGTCRRSRARPRGPWRGRGRSTRRSCSRRRSSPGSRPVFAAPFAMFSRL